MQGGREEIESGLLERVTLLRKLVERDADPQLNKLLAETESALNSLCDAEPVPAADRSGAGAFLPTGAA